MIFSGNTADENKKKRSLRNSNSNIEPDNVSSILLIYLI